MTLNDFLNSDYFQNYEHDFFNTNIYFMYDNKTIDRIFEAREDGCDGRTHFEVIDLWRDSIDCAWHDDVVTEKEYDDVVAEINKCELWHCENGSLFQTI